MNKNPSKAAYGSSKPPKTYGRAKTTDKRTKSAAPIVPVSKDVKKLTDQMLRGLGQD